MRLTFKPDVSKRMRRGCLARSVTVDGKTFTVIGYYQDRPKSAREYSLKGPDVALHTVFGRSYRAGSFGLGGFSITGGCTEENLIRDKVWLGRNMSFHTAEARAKEIIRKALGVKS